MKKQLKCIDCGKTISKYNAKRCVLCNKIHMKPKLIAEANLMWKGDNVGLKQLHDWIRKRKPKPIVCECCQTNPPTDLANISQEYKRDVDDYEWLCRYCHMHKDGRLIEFVKHRWNYKGE